MTAKETFEKIRDHLIAQGARATEGGKCRYLVQDGRKCAVGCLIQNYNLECELMDPFKLKDAKYIETEMSGGDLMQLQSIHDHDLVSEWPRKLKEFADARGY